MEVKGKLVQVSFGYFPGAGDAVTFDAQEEAKKQ